MVRSHDVIRANIAKRPDQGRGYEKSVGTKFTFRSRSHTSVGVVRA